MPESGKIIFNTYTLKYEAAVNWLDGEGKYDTRPDEDSYKDQLELIRYQAGSSPSKSSAAGYQKWDNAVDEVLSVEANGANSYDIRSGDLPAFSLDGAQYRYCVQQKPMDAKSPNFNSMVEDEFKVDARYTSLYDNSANNYTNITQYLYSGGELNNTLTAETQLTFTHTWLDGKQSAAEREGASTIYLYRVAESGDIASLEDSPVSGVVNTMGTPIGTSWIAISWP